ncbi:MAG TPA: cell wall-binding repeat-containing protein, partial [Solirubrobacterales bacterium]
MIPKRPINRDVPPTEETEAPPKEEAPTREEKLPSAPKSQTPKLLAGLVVLALVFIIAAIVFATGGDENKSNSEATTSAPASGGESAGEPSPQVAEALAFPAFATNNTTRIGGPDPVSNAAGVALAVFPSTTDSQRPAAVTLVDEEDWAGAIAASVLMAPPVRAPVLFSASDEMPEDSEEALSALAPQGSKATGGASLFAIGAVALPGDAGKVTRVDSGDPAATAAQIATLRERLADEPPKHFVIVPTQYPEYAMPAAAWAARSGDPVLYTDTKKLPPPTIQILKQHPKVPAYVLGPAGVVSLHAIGEISELVKKVGRLPGPGPGDVALDLARNRYGSFGWSVNDPGHGFVLTNSETPANAAAAAALSASGTWGPLLLTKDPDRLPVKVRSYL